MDSKTPLLPHTRKDANAMPRRPSPKRFSRFHAAAFVFIVALFWLARSWQCTDPTHHHDEETGSVKVPLEVHIM
jgi:hypothetical protein